MNCVNSVNTPPQRVPPHCWIHIVSDLFMPPLSSFGGVSFCLVPTWNIYPESIVIQCSITMGFAVQAQSKVCPSPKIVQNKSKSKVNPGFVQSIFLIRWKYLESKHNPIFVQTELSNLCQDFVQWTKDLDFIWWIIGQQCILFDKCWTRDASGQHRASAIAEIWGNGLRSKWVALS